MVLAQHTYCWARLISLLLSSQPTCIERYQERKEKKKITPSSYSQSSIFPIYPLSSRIIPSIERIKYTIFEFCTLCHDLTQLSFSSSQLLHWLFLRCVHHLLLLLLVLSCIPLDRQIRFKLFPGRRKTGFSFPYSFPSNEAGLDFVTGWCFLIFRSHLDFMGENQTRNQHLQFQADQVHQNS